MGQLSAKNTQHHEQVVDIRPELTQCRICPGARRPCFLQLGLGISIGMVLFAFFGFMHRLAPGSASAVWETTSSALNILMDITINQKVKCFPNTTAERVGQNGTPSAVLPSKSLCITPNDLWLGRLGNLIIPIMVWAVQTNAWGPGWTFTVDTSYQVRSQLLMYPELRSHSIHGCLDQCSRLVLVPSVVAKLHCKTYAPYYQNYETFRTSRELMSRVFRTQESIRSALSAKLDDSDIAIHVRFEELRGVNMKVAFPPLDYYTNSIRLINQTLVEEGFRSGFRNVWLMLEPGSEELDIVQGLRAFVPKGRFKVNRGSAVVDHSFGRIAKNLVCSTGTFSWTMAYLSEAKLIHMPFCSAVDENGFYPVHHLFIDDDARITYHDYCGTGLIGNSTSVLLQNSVYSSAVKLHMSEQNGCWPIPEPT
jgi:hypothetical protein